MIRNRGGTIVKSVNKSEINAGNALYRRLQRIRKIAGHTADAMRKLKFIEIAGRQIALGLRSLQGDKPSLAVQFEAGRKIEARNADISAHFEYGFWAHLSNKRQQKPARPRTLARHASLRDSHGGKVF